jgi:hypothetical protein
MKEIFRSKLGWILALVYLLLIIAASFEACLSKPQPMDSLGLLILTAPWSFLLGIVLSKIGVITVDNGDSFLPMIVSFGVTLNLLIFLLSGHLITRFARYLTRK